MKEQLLNGEWKLFFFRQDEHRILTPDGLKNSDKIDCVTAQVPGNVELDLTKAGYLPEDLFKGDNVVKTQDYEDYEWWYEKEFQCEEAFIQLKTRLLFEGVDTLAEYWLNGEYLGESENMLIPVEFNVTGRLKKNNIIHVRLRSVMLESYQKEYVESEVINSWELNRCSTNIRKAPHMFGWDIFPRVVSAGIWKNVKIQQVDEYEIVDVGFSVIDANDEQAQIRFTYDSNLRFVDVREGVEVKVTGICGEHVFEEKAVAYFKAGSIGVNVQNPQLWWPYGYGKANLYEVTLGIYKHNRCLAEKKFNIGIRTCRLERTETTDGKNGYFRFVINGVVVMCKGTNWVPLDAFHSRDILRYDRALELLRDIGCNIVRCWGGGVYPEDKFFDFCDQNGIMVWQDFSMACHAYPQTEEFYEKMRKEVTWVVNRFKTHPSLVLWAGDNECDGLYYYAGMNPAQNKITREVIPEVVHRNDVGRDYLPCSPYFSEKVYKNHIADQIPEDHLWGARDYYKSQYYRESKAHFVSETGYFGCPSRKTMEKFLDKEFVWPWKNNSQWILHSSDYKGCDARIVQMSQQIQQMFGMIPDNLDDYVHASQISQAEAKKYFIERVRKEKPQKSGVIWWNLLDGWPQFSDAVVDYYYEKKIAYNVIKRSQEPFFIMIDEIEDWNVKVIASNDTLEQKNGTYRITDIESAQILLEGKFSVKANANKVLGKLPVMYSQQGMFIIEWFIEGKRYLNHYLYGTPPFSFEKYVKWMNLLIGCENGE